MFKSFFNGLILFIAFIMSEWIFLKGLWNFFVQLWYVITDPISFSKPILIDSLCEAFLGFVLVGICIFLWMWEVIERD